MKKTIRFTMRLGPQDREAIKLLADKLGRSDSDAVRTVIREASKVMKLTSPAGNPAVVNLSDNC